jgi:hypothetical protein
MYNPAWLEFVSERSLALTDVSVHLSRTLEVTVSLQIESSVQTGRTLLVTGFGRDPIRVPFQLLHREGFGDLPERQQPLVRALRRRFATELARRREQLRAAVPFTYHHLQFSDATQGYLTLASRYGRVFLYRDHRLGMLRLVLTEAPRGHSLQSALYANKGDPIEIWLTGTVDDPYRTILRIQRQKSAQSLLGHFLQQQFPQPIDIDLSEE